MMHGIYIHVPFCRNKCDYCGFFSVPIDRFSSSMQVPDSYVDRLIREIGERLAGRGIEADTIYFGGGTPSLLGTGQMRAILRSINACAHIGAAAEITVEMNPEDVSRDKLAGFSGAGVNRIVLGVQTLSGRLHDIIGRSVGICSADTLDMFFSAGGIQHCVDVMTGIPSQTDEEFYRDMDSITAYRPAHISAYLLSIEKNTPLGRNLSYATDMEQGQLRFFELTASLLAQRGYVRYEISNYAMPGCQSRHNMKYWMYSPYIGFGPGAHSFFDGARSSNALSVADYIHSVHTIIEYDVRTPESAAVEYILTGLRLLSGFSIRQMEERLHYILPQRVTDRIREAQSDGMIIVSEDERGAFMRLSEKGLPLADRVIYRIVEALL